MGQVYSVSQINRYVGNMFARDGRLQGITIRGEVWGCKYHNSGHLYFTLKDEGAGIACVMFAGWRNGLRFRMENGQRVLAKGSVGVYERDGKYQLYANEILMDGMGALYERFERLKQNLKEEGLFCEDHKKKIPKYVNTIGIVTADTGSVLQDVINVSNRRNPYVQLVLCPAKVQGEGAAASIASGIRALDEFGPDVIIVGRGGGSFEDLFAFNEEVVARAIYHCKTPVISAVGHETDTTIADYVADLRAPTPSAAAEMAVYNLVEFCAELDGYAKRLHRQMDGKIKESRLRVTRYMERLQYASPRQTILQKRHYLMDLQNRATNRMDHRIQKDKHRLAICEERLKGLSPLNKLKGGFSYITNEKGEAIKSIRQTRVGGIMQVTLSDGNLQARIEEVNEGEGILTYGKKNDG